MDHMLAKFEPNRMVLNVQNFELFDKNKTKQLKKQNKTKQNKSKHFCQSVDANLQDVSS